jgi:hypothetical protein
MAFALLGKINIEKHLKKYDKNADISEIFSGLPVSNAIWADDNWAGKNQWEFKVSATNHQKLISKFGATAAYGKKSFNQEVDGITIKFTSSGLKPGSTPLKGSGGRDKTKMQEDASMFIMKHALQNRKRPWPNLQAYLNDPAVADILDKYYPDTGPIWESWRETYYKQSETILKVASGENWTEFSRDEGFMVWISDLIKKRFKISQKDTWNPADIWLIHNERATMRYIEEAIGKAGTVQQLNVAFRNLFNLNLLPNESVMGISLKKISGPVAKWQVYNLTDADGNRVTGSFNPDAITYPIQSIKLGLHMTANSSAGGEAMTNIFTEVFVGDQVNDRIKLQIGRHPSGFANMKYEGNDENARAAKLGKSPVAEVEKILQAYGVHHERSHKSYPTTSQAFRQKRTDYKRMLNKLKSNNKVSFTGGNVPEISCSEALDNLEQQFNGSDPGRANTKCQQIDLIYKVFEASKSERIFTDIIFHAQKIGDKYGPFGKLY